MTQNNVQLQDGNGSLAGLRNQIINGDFRINQRVTIGPVSAYTADRWRPNTVQTLLQWKTTNPGTNIPFGNYLGVTSSATQSVVAQLIELPSPGNWGPFESGSTWTLSWYTQQDLTDVAIYVDFVDSSAGTNSQACTVGTPQLIESSAWGSSFNRYAATVTITGTIAATNAALRLYYVGTNSKAFDLARVQLEPGPIATPFEQRPIGMELSLCQRYFQKLVSLYMYDVSSAGVKVLSLPRTVTMRAAPTETITGYIVGTTPFSGTGSLIFAGDPGLVFISNITNTAGVSLQNYSADAEL